MRAADVERVIRALRTEARLCGDTRGADALTFCLELVDAQREAERAQRSRDERMPSQSGGTQERRRRR